MAVKLCRCSVYRVSALCVCMSLWLSLAARSAYISKVYEYKPAPGQFVNLMPACADTDTEESMRLKAEALLCSPDSGTITLGGWGGYVIFGFDHPVVNIQGEYDLRILGNAFYADKNDPSKGGSSEPGVVWVSRDDNLNGKPDDTWYELAGSEYERSVHGYQLTYFRTPSDHKRTPKPAEDLVDTTYILWRDQNGKRGYITQNRYHLQDYYPKWLTDDRLVFAGTLLPDNAVPYAEEGKTKYMMGIYAFGYADNHPNDNEGSKLNLDWAVTQRGEPARLDRIDFVKVQTGVNQQCGWIGETSTEVSGAIDLHPQATPSDAGEFQVSGFKSQKKILIDGHLYIMHGDEIYDILGNRITNIYIQ